MCSVLYPQNLMSDNRFHSEALTVKVDEDKSCSTLLVFEMGIFSPVPTAWGGNASPLGDVALVYIIFTH